MAVGDLKTAKIHQKYIKMAATHLLKDVFSNTPFKGFQNFDLKKKEIKKMK